MPKLLHDKARFFFSLQFQLHPLALSQAFTFATVVGRQQIPQPGHFTPAEFPTQIPAVTHGVETTAGAFGHEALDDLVHEAHDSRDVDEEFLFEQFRVVLGEYLDGLLAGGFHRRRLPHERDGLVVVHLRDLVRVPCRIGGGQRHGRGGEGEVPRRREGEFHQGDAPVEESGGRGEIQSVSRMIDGGPVEGKDEEWRRKDPGN